MSGSNSKRSRKRTLASSHLQVLEIISGLDPFRAAERSIVEVHPRSGDAPVVERDRRLDACVEARVGFALAIAFDVVELAQHGVGVTHLMDLAPHAAVGGGDGGWVDAEIEQRSVDPGASFGPQLRVETLPARAPECAHEGAVEKHEVGHGRRTPAARVRYRP